MFLDAFRDGDGKSVGRPARKPVINRSYEGYVAKDERSVYVTSTEIRLPGLKLACAKCER